MYMSVYESLIDAHRAYELKQSDQCLFVDCSYSLQDHDWGLRSYLESHLPDAHFVSLETEMSSPFIAGKTGRHPLPTHQQVKSLLERLGIKPSTQVIVYDQQNGASAAARFWWLLKWAGHHAVAVLIGGKSAWEKHFALTDHLPPVPEPSVYPAKFNDHLWLDADFLSNHLHDPKYIPVDARAIERYRGEIEPIDPVAGHIPSAKNVPYLSLLDKDGLPLENHLIRETFEKAGAHTPENLIFYCGSGVTACFNALLYSHAFNGKLPKIYPGSWSDWVSNKSANRPIETGNPS